MADTYRNRVLKVSPKHEVSVIAGFNQLPDEVEGGPGALAHHDSPEGLAVSVNAEVFIADTTLNRICRISKDGRFFRAPGKGKAILRDHRTRPGPQFSGDGGMATWLIWICPPEWP